MTESLNKMKGKIPEIASSHVSSRVLQVSFYLLSSLTPLLTHPFIDMSCVPGFVLCRYFQLCFSLQTCVKHCSQDERNAVFLELRPHFISLATNAYAVHLVTKMLDNGMVRLDLAINMLIWFMEDGPNVFSGIGKTINC